MANNVISQMLEADPKFLPMWAAKLDRLVEAARKASGLIQHSSGCSLRYFTHRQICDCGYVGCRSELAAALAAVELPKSEVKGE